MVGPQSDPKKALEAVRGDLYDNSIPGGGDGMGCLRSMYMGE